MISFSSWEFKGQKQPQRKTPMEGRRRVRRCVRATKAPVFGGCLFVICLLAR